MIINAKTGKVISLGRVRDDKATTIRFDLSEWVAQYGAGTVTGRYMLNTLIVDVPSQTVNAANPNFDWLITSSVTTTAGIGRFIYTFTSETGGIVKVSPYYDTLLTTSDYYDEDYSENYRTWLDTLNTLVVELTNKREEFQANLVASHDWAVGPEGVWGNPTATNNSRYYSEISQGHAENAYTYEQKIEKLEIHQQIVDANAEGIDVKKEVDPVDGHFIYTFKIPVNNPLKFAYWYESIAAMVADWSSPLVQPGQFVIIIGEQTSADYGKIFVKLTDQEGPAETPGWFFLVGLAGASAIQGPHGFGIDGMSIDANGVVTTHREDGSTIVATGDTFYQWTSEQKNAITTLKNDTVSAKEAAIVAKELAAKWVNFNDTSSAPSATNNAKSYSDNANNKAAIATDKALLAESWAKGGVNTAEKTIREGEDTNNSKYWSEQSSEYADNSSASATTSKSWAIGDTSSREGEDTNNSKYWSEQSEVFKTAANESAVASKDWAIGPTGTGTASDTNNAKYWSQQSSGYNDNSKGYAEVASEYARGKKLDGTAVISGETGFQDNSYYYKELAINAKTAAETAQGLSEDARDAALEAKRLSEVAQGKSETAQGLSESAQGKSETAQGKAEAAQTAAENAKRDAETAKGLAETAKSDAVTAKGAAEVAQGQAQGFATNSQTYAETSREYAEGKKLDGTAVVSGETGFENNAKYWSGQSSVYATNSYVSAGNAKTSEDNSAMWATGGTTGTPTSTNNALYYSQQASVEKNRIANMTVSATKVAPETEDIQPTKSTNPDGSLNIAFKIPQGYKGDTGNTGNGVASFEAVSAQHTPGTFDTYKMTFTDSSMTPFTMKVWNGVDGNGDVSSVNNVYPVDGNVTLNKDNGGVVLTNYISFSKAADWSETNDHYELKFDF